MIKVIGPITADTFDAFMSHVDPTVWPWGDTSIIHSSDDVLISGPGGDVGYTLAMLDDIDEHKRATRATGICENESAVLACAGEGRRVCTMDTLFRFVSPVSRYGDPVPDIQYYLHSVLVARLAARMKTNKVEVYDLFDGEFISSARAKELGLVDEVISTAPAAVEEKQNGDSDRLSEGEGIVVEPEAIKLLRRTGTFISGRDVRVQPPPEAGTGGDNSGSSNSESGS